MKKIVIAIVAVAAMTLAIGNVRAEDKNAGLEVTGHIMTGFGFQYVGSNSAGYTGSLAGLSRDGWSNFPGTTSGAGGAAATRSWQDKAKDFGFLVDNVELNLMKTFGENIKSRVDLLFGDSAIGSWDKVANGVTLWQAYVTANIPVGNGLEMLVGRFDAPIGYESGHRYQNNTITRSSLFNFGIRPWTLTGLKLYYAFSDAIDWHIYAVNNLEDQMGGVWNSDNSPMPSFGTRVGYTWGEEKAESTIGLSAAFGPEQKDKTTATNPTSKIGRMSFLVDLDWNIWATDAFAIGGEGIFRQDDKAKNATDGKAQKYFGGILDLHYVFSDVWDGTLKYSILWQNGGSATSLSGGADAIGEAFGNYAPQTAIVGGNQKAYFNEISLAGGYQITDGAKFNAEYRLDWSKYNLSTKNITHSVLGMFAYSF